jgi:hypothetical protein
MTNKFIAAILLATLSIGLIATDRANASDTFCNAYPQHWMCKNKVKGKAKMKPKTRLEREAEARANATINRATGDMMTPGNYGTTRDPRRLCTTQEVSHRDNCRRY